MSYQSTSESRFIGLSALLREMYLSDIINLVSKVGTPTMKMLAMSTTRTEERDNWLQYITARADNTRMGDDLLEDFGAPDERRGSKLNYRYNPDSPAQNDFRGIDGVGRTSIAELSATKGETGKMVALAKEISDDIFTGLDEKVSMYLHCDSTNQLGSIATGSTIKGATTDFENGGSSYTAGTKVASFLLDGHSIAVFRRGDLLHLYDGSGDLTADFAKVRHVDYDQEVVVIEGTKRTTVANFDSVAAGDKIYRSFDRNKGFKTAFGEVFNPSISSGESWIGGVDRTQLEYLHLQPPMVRRGVTPEIPSEEHLDQIGNMVEMGHDDEDGERTAWKILMGTKLARAFRNNVGGQPLLVAPTGDNAHHKRGNLSLKYVDPSLGEIDIVGDRTAKNDRMLFIDPDSIEILRAGIEDLWIPTQDGNGPGLFERMPGTGSENGGSKYYKIEASTWLLPYWKRFDRSTAIHGLTPGY